MAFYFAYFLKFFLITLPFSEGGSVNKDKTLWERIFGRGCTTGMIL